MSLQSTSKTPLVPLRGGALKRMRKRVKRARNRALAVTLWMRNYASRKTGVGDLPLSVSLTSHGERLRTVALAIESIAAGSSTPNRLILWLDDDEDLRKSGLPASLKRLQRRGLEIAVAPKVGPHGKYFGYVNSLAAHQVPLVTADDDVMYPRYWLGRLYSAHLKHPQNSHCYWAKHMTTANGSIAPYGLWPVVTGTQAHPRNFALGVSGVIYPPSLLNELARRGRGFSESCPRADDIWLHFTALQCGISVRQISATAHHFPLIPGTQGNALLEGNVANGGNDLSIEKLYSEGEIESLQSPMPIQLM